MDEFPTARLLLRRFRRSDARALHGYLSLPEVVRYEPYPVQSVEDCERLADERAGRTDMWAVCLRDSGEVIGNLYLHRNEPQAWRTWELGYVLHPDHWGRGYASEGASALVTTCFRAWAAHRVTAGCDPRNAASWRLLERLGFRREGHFRANAFFETDATGNPVWHDSYFYAVLAEEWQSPPPGRGFAGTGEPAPTYARRHDSG